MQIGKIIGMQKSAEKVRKGTSMPKPKLMVTYFEVISILNAHVIFELK